LGNDSFPHPDVDLFGHKELQDGLVT
jgi:hypothetical protein